MANASLIRPLLSRYALLEGASSVGGESLVFSQVGAGMGGLPKALGLVCFGAIVETSPTLYYCMLEVEWRDQSDTHPPLSASYRDIQANVYAPHAILCQPRIRYHQSVKFQPASAAVQDHAHIYIPGQALLSFGPFESHLPKGISHRIAPYLCLLAFPRARSITHRMPPCKADENSYAV